MAIRGWVSRSKSVPDRKPLDFSANLAGGPDNPHVTSKTNRREREHFSSDPRQPREPGDGPYRDEVNPDSSITNHNKPFVHHVEPWAGIHTPVTSTGRLTRMRTRRQQATQSIRMRR